MTDQPDLPPELLERVVETIKLCRKNAHSYRVKELAKQGLWPESNWWPSEEVIARAVAPMLIAHGRGLEKAEVVAGETLASMVAWGDETFGPCTQQRAIERAGEEWDEMEEPGADVPIEAADVIICLLRIPGILDAINRKMKINRGRIWNIRPDGTGYHVKNNEHRSKP